MSAVTNPSTALRLAGLVDTLGNINAEIALLERQAKAIKAELTCSGESVIEGSMFRAAISVAERLSLDTKAATSLLESIGMQPPMKSALVTTVRMSDL